MRRPRIALLGHEPFRRYFAAVAVSAVGTSATVAVVPLVVLAETGSAPLTAFAASASYFPFLLFGLVAGALTDRMDRRRIMIAADLVSAGAAVLPFVLSHSGIGLAGAIIVARLVISTADVWFGAANFGSLPIVVGDRTRIVDATTLMMNTTTAIGLFVPALAVLVLNTFGALPVLAVNAVTFLLAALLRSRVRVVAAAGHVAVPLSAALRHVGGDILVGLRHLFAHPLLRVVTVAGFFGAVASGAVITLIAVYAADTFGLAPDDPLQGVFLTAAAVGVIALSWVLPLLHRRWEPLPTLLVLQVAACLTGLALAAAPNVAVAIVAFGVFNAWSTLLVTNGITLRMRLLPDELQGRVGSAGRLIAWAGTPVGGICAGLVAEQLPLRTVFASLSLVWIVAMLIVGAAALNRRGRGRRGRA